MIKELADQLDKGVVLTVTIRKANQEKYPGQYMFLLTGKPTHKPNNPDAVKSPNPIIRIGTPEELDQKLSSQEISSLMWDFTRQVANDAAFKKSITENNEAADTKAAKTKSAATKTAAKTEAVAKPTAEQTRIAGEIKVLVSKMDECQKNIDDAAKEKADKCWKAIVGLYNALKEHLTPEIKERAKKIREHIKAMPVQTEMEL